MDKLEITVSCASGSEALTKKELRLLGYGEAPAINGRITVLGGLEDVAKLNICLRTAERVFVKVGETSAPDWDALFEGVLAMPWENYIERDGAVNVRGKSVKSLLHSVPACQRMVKKAIVTRLGSKYGLNGLPETGAVYPVEVALYEDRATLLLDTTGKDGLHKRGYRDLSVAAPLRETTAAALVMLANWSFRDVLADPFCGSGTIPIEAAMFALNIAPGANRSFLFEQWKDYEGCKDLAVKEAEERTKRDMKIKIYASDIDVDCVTMARRHAKRAGVDRCIEFSKADAREFYAAEANGTILSNLPYGERLEENDLVGLYKDFGKAVKALKNWSCYALTSYDAFERAFGRRADKIRKVYNSGIECRLYGYLKR